MTRIGTLAQNPLMAQDFVGALDQGTAGGAAAGRGPSPGLRGRPRGPAGQIRPSALKLATPSRPTTR